MTPIIIYLLISLLIGSISCLFGKKLYFPILMLTVFGTVVTVSFSLFDLTLKVGVITVFVGLISALLARLFYKFGVFLLGSVLGGIFGLFAVSFLPSAADPYSWILILLIAVIAGVCSVKWCDGFIMVSTSFNGAFAIAVPICFLFVEFHNLQNFIYADGMMSTMKNLNQYLNNQFPLEHGAMVFITTILIASGGLIFQVISDKKHRQES